MVYIQMTGSSQSHTISILHGSLPLPSEPWEQHRHVRVTPHSDLHPPPQNGHHFCSLLLNLHNFLLWPALTKDIREGNYVKHCSTEQRWNITKMLHSSNKIFQGSELIFIEKQNQIFLARMHHGSWDTCRLQVPLSWPAPGEWWPTQGSKEFWRVWPLREIYNDYFQFIIRQEF